MDEEIAKWILTVSAATLAAYFGSRIALGRTKREKLWQLKQDAYVKILESLHGIILWADEAYSSELPLPSVSKEKLKKLHLSHQNAIDTLRKYVHMGELIISEEAAKKLDEILSSYYGEHSRFYDEPFHEHESNDKHAEHYLKIRNIVENHLEDVRCIAKKDLS